MEEDRIGPNNPVLLLSLKPRWVDAILLGGKRYEFRRRPPALNGATETLVYSSRPDACLRARCLSGPVISATPEKLWALVETGAGLSRLEFDRYFVGMSKAHAIMLSDVRELTPRLTLAELREAIGFVAPQSWMWAKFALCNMVGLSQ